MSTTMARYKIKTFMWTVCVVVCILSPSIAFADENVLTFFGWSDQHVTADGDGAHLIPAIDAMNKLPGRSYPANIGGKVDEPDFVMGLGDITEWPSQAARDTYERLITKRLRFRSYDVAGNHDGGGLTPSATMHDWLIKRHGSLSYTFDKKGVHFVALYSRYDESLNNPAQPIAQDALGYLREDLAKVPAGTPVVVATHLCFEAITNRDELVDAFGDANVILVLGGHYHKATVNKYRGVNFVQLPSPAPGSPSEVTVIRIGSDRLVAIAFDYEKGQWCADPKKILWHGLPARGEIHGQDGHATTSPAAPEVKTMTYKTVGEGQLKIQIHYPPGWKASDSRPAIIFFFGGGWTSGTVGQFEPQAAYFASRGLIAARADYRVKSRDDVTPDKCVEDARSAVRWLRRNARELGIDPQKLIASGGSAGGHLAACTMIRDCVEADGDDLSISTMPQAMVLFNPVLRFDHEQMIGRIDGDKQLARKISPTLHLDKNSPPALILFGTKDRLKVFGDEYWEKAEALAVRADKYLAEGQGHGFFNKSPWRERTLIAADRFLASLGFLKGEPTIKTPDDNEGDRP